jgi:hypothetical protein
MAELKTKPTGKSVEKFIAGIADEGMREDARAVLKMMKRATGAEPKLWGTSIVGFGDYRYKYASGREGDWFLTGFSPRKQGLSIYLMSGLASQEALLKKLGKHKTGMGCLYIKRLADVDSSILAKMIERTVRTLSGRSR